MPKQPKVTVDGKPIEDVLDVSYSIGSGWDRTTGKATGEVAYSPLVITKMMTKQSWDFFAKAAKPSGKRFPVVVEFNWVEAGTETWYVRITLTNAVMLDYAIEHGNWKDTKMDNYTAAREFLTLGYEKLKIETPNGNHEVEFKPKK